MRAATFVALLLLLTVAPVASAHEERAVDSVNAWLAHDGSIARIDVELTLLDPAVQGAATVLDVTLTPRLASAGRVDAILSLDPRVTLVASVGTTTGALQADEPAHARYVLSVIDPGMYPLSVHAVAPPLEGYRQAWIVVEPLMPARLILDFLPLDAAILDAEPTLNAPSGPLPTDDRTEIPEPGVGRAPAPDGLATSQPLGALSAPALSGSVEVRACWTFSLSDFKSGPFLRQRDVTYRAYVGTPGAYLEYPPMLVGEDGCATLSVPRSWGGDPTWAWFRFYACNANVCVENPMNSATYSWKIPAMKVGDATGARYDFGAWHATQAMYASRQEAFGNNGWTFVVNSAKHPRSMIPSVTIKIPSQSIKTDSCKSGCYDFTDIWIPANGEADMREDTTIHEFAHHVHYNSVSDWANPGGYHELCGEYQDPRLAWSEGFANFVAVRANYILGLKGVPGASGDTLKGTTDIETSTCGDGGTQNEWRVARSLWDLVDIATDGADDRSESIANVFDVMRGCEAETFLQFYTAGTCGWRAREGSSCSFLRAAYQNGYDANEAPILAFNEPSSDRWVRGYVHLTSTVVDLDLGSDPCPISVKYGTKASPGLACATSVYGFGSERDADLSTMSLTNGASLYVCAIASDGMESTQRNSTGRIRIDNALPAFAYDLQGTLQNGWYTSAVTLTLTCSDAHSGLAAREVRIDGGAWTAYISPVTLGVSGVRDIALRCVDVAGNAKEVAGPLYIDRDAPTTTITAPTFAWTNDEVTFDLDCDDASGASGCDKTRWRVDGGSWMADVGAVTLTTEGARVVEAYSIDKAGNIGPTVSRTIRIDRSAPALSHSLAGTLRNGWYSSAVDITLTCTDAFSGVASREIRLDGGAWAPYTSPVTLGVSGERAVAFRCTDAVGITATHAIIVRIDRVAPVTTIYGGTTSWSASARTLSISCDDGALSGCGSTFYQVRGDPTWTIYQPPVVWSRQGSYWIDTYSVDTAGNAGPVASALYRTDTSDPTYSDYFAGWKGADTWSNGNINAAVLCTDGISGIGLRTRAVDGGAWTYANESFIYSLTGIHTLTMACYDNAGNVNSTTRQIKIDQLAPAQWGNTTNITASGWSRFPIDLSMQCSDAQSGCRGITYRFNGGAWAGYPSGETRHIVASGDNLAEFYSSDWADNEAPILSIPVRFDPGAPVLNYTLDGTLGSNGYYTSSVNLTLGCSDALSGVAAREYRLNNGTWVAMGTSIAFGVSSVRWLDLRCTDVAGNERISSFLLKIDRNAPTVASFSSAVSGSSFIVNWSASDAVSGLASVVVQEQRFRSTTWTSVCTTSSPGMSASGACTRPGDYSTTCYRLMVTDIAGWVTTSATTCVVLAHE